MKRLISAIFILILFPAHLVFAESSAEYASKSKMAWSAFECTALASYAKKNKSEQKMLFELGYNEGKAFLLAWSEKKISEEDMRSKVPIFFRLLSGGPNFDFSLGRVYEFIVNSSHEKISKEITGETSKLNDELRESVAARLFDEKNCLLINPDFPNVK